ncbi:MAG: multicopper oxidase domain-containing protein, partial [Chloroflexi bacterium]|nr:multicopper oxidase domain-containing protein [Chloroflexota bacterium]
MTSVGNRLGHGMDAVPDQGMPNATATRGGQPLAPRIESGVKVFELTATPVKWPILKDVIATAWTYNGTVPGPMIRVTEGDKVRIVLKNNLPNATSIHWHGIPVPNAMDGVPPFTQNAVKPGEMFTYEFTTSPAGTFMYHSHVDTDMQIPIGLYAPFIIDPKDNAKRPDVDVTLMLSEWRVVGSKTYAAMPMGGMEPNYFTINGKAFPETEPINAKV